MDSRTITIDLDKATDSIAKLVDGATKGLRRKYYVELFEYFISTGYFKQDDLDDLSELSDTVFYETFLKLLEFNMTVCETTFSTSDDETVYDDVL